MKAMIMAAGLGTRLKPWTEHHPKALVPVDGIPALEHLILKLKNNGFDHIVVNVHHFADQIKEFVASKDFGVGIELSDESEMLLDTGGGLAKASEKLLYDEEPVLVHNVDILSNTDFEWLMERHVGSGADITLMTSDRDSTRKLIFDEKGTLRGWHNLKSGEYRPVGFVAEEGLAEEAFSGIYVVGAKALRDISVYAAQRCERKFPVMDYFLSSPEAVRIQRCHNSGLRMLDIGKPESLARASEFLV